ncbi:MAG: pitrilysin family protein [Polyangiaceae bacterium]|nr:pitrilysin family protein [Polyangiaceae bacterium]
MKPLAALASEVTRLGSGLTVHTIAMPNVHRMVLNAHLRIGPRFEAAKDNGLSHFLEHMLFRGTTTHPSAHLQALAYERLGGTLQGATYADHGTLSISFPPENFEPILQLLGETMLAPVFSAIEIERGIVREEILEGLDEDGQLVEAETLVRALSFQDHPLSYPIIGQRDHLDGFDEAALARHHRAHYTANNCVISVAGPLDAEAVTRGVENTFRALPQGAVPQSPPPPQQKGARARFVQHNSSQTALRLVFRAPQEHAPMEPACDMLLRILDDGMSTRLYHRICDSQGLCYDASAGYETYTDTGLVELGADASHERAPYVAEELLRLTEELRQAPPRDAELAKARARLRWQMDMLLDEPESCAEFFALGELSGRPDSPAVRLEQLLSVSAADIQAAAAHVFQGSGLSGVAVGMLTRKQQQAFEEMLLGYR